jgi:predicted DsbA family dithiol-disulfide isomerase
LTTIVDVTHYTDPGCPWAYSAEPAFTALRYRYGTGLRWRMVVIGLSEGPADYDARGYKPDRSAAGRTSFARRFGMPFLHHARPRNQGTGLACRTIKAAELQGVDLGNAAARALRFGFFASDGMMDTPEAIRDALAIVDGLDVDRVLADVQTPAVEEAYQRDRAEVRDATVTGKPAIAQDKTADSDGAVRYTAPSLTFSQGDRRLVAGGWQSLEAYDVCIANLAPDLERRPTPTPAELVAAFPHGVTTQEVATACTDPLDEVDRQGTLKTLLLLEAAGTIRWRRLGDDALWLPA